MDLDVARSTGKLVKGVWWLLTPWRLRRRLAASRAQADAVAEAAQVEILRAAEAARAAARHRGEPVAPTTPLDLFDDSDVARAAGRPFRHLVWPATPAHRVVDRWTAARFVVDLWRRRPDLRLRFPRALAEGRDGGFASWLRVEGPRALGLSSQGVQASMDAFDARPGARARQAFLAHDDVHGALPHGLTPAGTRALFGYFMQGGGAVAGLRNEEVWWLFLQAEADPQEELMRAWDFCPAWQGLHPDGASVFGREAFVDWFCAEYGAAGAWLHPPGWPQHAPPAQEIRSACAQRAEWRRAHPMATATVADATRFLAWLASSPEAGVSGAAQHWCRHLAQDEVAAQLAAPGVNVLGHFCYPSGLRVSVESMVAGMRSAGVSVNLRDVRTGARDEPRHADYRGAECHDVTILHVQPEPFFDVAHAQAHLHERSPRPYRIAYWYWEFDRIPDDWMAHEHKVDEVWAATEFVARGLRARFSVPVRTLFPGVRLAPFAHRGKAHFGLREDCFTFLFTFHMASVMERKNPLGLIRAFKEAFAPGEATELVLKTAFGRNFPAEFAELQAAAGGASIRIIDESYDADEVLSLTHACDAYVSLHRSEGLGLTMAEAMLMGKPVIATGFSGNVDFMEEGNSLLVPSERVKVGRAIPPYGADLEWAEPSVPAAARHMRHLYDDRDAARALGDRARASAEVHLSVASAGRRMAARLEEIRALRRATR